MKTEQLDIPEEIKIQVDESGPKTHDKEIIADSHSMSNPLDYFTGVEESAQSKTKEMAEM